MKTWIRSNGSVYFLAIWIAGTLGLRSFGTPINLIQNGSFEQGNSYTGWTLSGGLLNLGGAGAGVQCADGYNAVGLSWQSTLYQDVATVIGEQYISVSTWQIGGRMPCQQTRFI